MCLAVVLFAGVMFTSCEKKSDSELLWGKWSITSMTATLENGMTGEVKVENNQYAFFTFASDGRYSADFNAFGIKNTGTGVWVLEGKMLILDKGTVDEEVYTIRELNASKLSMEGRIDGDQVVLNMTKVK